MPPRTQRGVLEQGPPGGETPTTLQKGWREQAALGASPGEAKPSQLGRVGSPVLQRQRSRSTGLQLASVA